MRASNSVRSNEGAIQEPTDQWFQGYDPFGDDHLYRHNGAAGPWTELLHIQGPANDTAYLYESQNISAYIASDTRIRFITSPDMGGQDAVWIDDVEIEISP